MFLIAAGRSECICHRLRKRRRTMSLQLTRAAFWFFAVFSREAALATERKGSQLEGFAWEHLRLQLALIRTLGQSAWLTAWASNSSSPIGRSASIRCVH